MTAFSLPAGARAQGGLSHVAKIMLPALAVLISLAGDGRAVLNDFGELRARTQEPRACSPVSRQEPSHEVAPTHFILSDNRSTAAPAAATVDGTTGADELAKASQEQVIPARSDDPSLYREVRSELAYARHPGADAGSCGSASAGSSPALATHQNSYQFAKGSSERTRSERGDDPERLSAGTGGGAQGARATRNGSARSDVARLTAWRDAASLADLEVSSAPLSDEDGAKTPGLGLPRIEAWENDGKPVRTGDPNAAQTARWAGESRSRDRGESSASALA